MDKFTVDTHIFRELGELLVGRDSTALIELIKNSYDADATEVIVDGQRLDDPEHGCIIIKDNGVGMTPKQFEEGFLRIASRVKEGGSRKSFKYTRRYTGAKGIGRLAAHKLAKLLRVYSVPNKDAAGPNAQAVGATIDWFLVEKQDTLEDLAGTGAIKVKPEDPPKNATPGTIIELRKLRRHWTKVERAHFFAEAQSFAPPPVLVTPTSKNKDLALLFAEPKVRDQQESDPGFDVKLTGDLEAGEEYWPALFQAAQWLIEVDCRRSDGKVHFNIVPTKKGREEYLDAKGRIYVGPHPTPKTGPFFQSRILLREGGGGNQAERAWLGRSYGIRVYMEGFRVLPYGEPGDDWLSIDADYNKRQKTLTFLSDLGFAGEPVDETEGHQFLGNSHYFGAVFLTQSDSPTLRMLVNREGFIPNPEFGSVTNILRTAIHLSTRVRAAAKISERAEWGEKRKGGVEIDPSRLVLRQAVESSVKRASELANEARKFAAGGDFTKAKQRIDQASSVFREAGATSQRLMSEGAILRVLASVGTQMAAFVHEIRGLLGSAVALEEAISRIRENEELPESARKQIAPIMGAIGDLRRSVERQAAYLTDVTSPDARRRRSRQKLAERFDAGSRLVELAAQRRGIKIINNIPSDLKSPPMFLAELTLVFSNLLTNAVKAAGRKGKIWAHAKHDREGTIVLRIENTGVSVNPVKGERWFKPFESTTVESDPVLGQGMGMGLPITRNILEEYGSTIRFVHPGKGYSAAIELRMQE
jgi:signal transduction histidine kinase